MNPVSTEPVLLSLVATAVAWIAARYGLKVTPDQATIVAGIVAGVVSPFVRQLVRPLAKDHPVADVPSTEPDDHTVIGHL